MGEDDPTLEVIQVMISNPASLSLWYTIEKNYSNEYTWGKDSLVPLMHYVPSDPDPDQRNVSYPKESFTSLLTLNASSPMYSK